MSGSDFPIEDVFDEDYLYFYDAFLTDERSDAEAQRAWEALALEPGAAVLDIGCGHGRIANRLAGRGARVTGLDATALFLERARLDAAAAGVDVEYVHGDMRELPWVERFDAALLWFTTFGYFDDAGNRRVLEQAHSALRDGGRLALELHNLFAFARHFLPVTLTRRDGDLLVDVHRFDAWTGRLETDRHVVREGRARRTSYTVRFFAFTELRDLLHSVGFRSVTGLDREGGALTAETRRMVVIATR